MNSNYFLNLKALCIMASVALLFSACTVDPCEDVVCQNDGVCVEGDCDCPDGFTGTECADTYAESVVGIYDVLNSCNSGPAYTSEITVDPDFPSQNNRIRIYNPTGIGDNFFYPATITSDTEINIPAFVVVGAGIEGSGTGEIRADGSIQLTVNYDGSECVEVFTPQ